MVRLLLMMATIMCMVSCGKSNDDPDNPIDPTDDSPAGIVAGTYTGNATRWYSGNNPLCICPSQIAGYTSSGPSTITITKVDDSRIKISVLGPFQSFQEYTASVTKTGSTITITPTFLVNCSVDPSAGTAHCSDYLGANYITFSNNVLVGKLDMSASVATSQTACMQGCGTPNNNSNTWRRLDGVQFQGTK